MTPTLTNLTNDLRLKTNTDGFLRAVCQACHEPCILIGLVWRHSIDGNKHTAHAPVIDEALVIRPDTPQAVQVVRQSDTKDQPTWSTHACAAPWCNVEVDGGPRCEPGQCERYRQALQQWANQQHWEAA